MVCDDTECIVIDAAHNAAPIVEAVAGRTVLLTHAHNDHISAVEALCATIGAPAYLHPDDRVLRDKLFAAPPGRELADGNEFTVGA